VRISVGSPRILGISLDIDTSIYTRRGAEARMYSTSVHGHVVGSRVRRCTVWYWDRLVAELTQHLYVKRKIVCSRNPGHPTSTILQLRVKEEQRTAS
jgi:hypothetical protein